MTKPGRFISILILCGAIAATTQRDCATILNTGSTNTAGYMISVWSDGTATAKIQGGQAKPFTVPPQTTSRFFTDLKAAKANGQQLQQCMKSASFGSRTVVQWDGWTSPDFQCPPFTPAVAALAKDVSAIQGAASINASAGQQLHRVGLPGDMRKIPSPTPEVQPT